VFGDIAAARSRLLNATSAAPQERMETSLQNKSKQSSMQTTVSRHAVERLLSLTESYPQLNLGELSKIPGLAGRNRE